MNDEPEIPDETPKIAEPGQPAPAEVRQRATAVTARVQALARLCAQTKFPLDPTTACAMLAMGVSMLALPQSRIDPRYLDLLIVEMELLGKELANRTTIEASRRRNAGKN